MVYQICDDMIAIGTWDSAFLNISFEPQLIKVYLHYKIITSPNESSEAQVKIFLVLEKLCFILKIFKFFCF